MEGLFLPKPRPLPSRGHPDTCHVHPVETSVSKDWSCICSWETKKLCEKNWMKIASFTWDLLFLVFLSKESLDEQTTIIYAKRLSVGTKKSPNKIIVVLKNHGWKARKSKSTKLFPLVFGNLTYTDHSKDHSLFNLGLPGEMYDAFWILRFVV